MRRPLIRQPWFMLVFWVIAVIAAAIGASYGGSIGHAANSTPEIAAEEVSGTTVLFQGMAWVIGGGLGFMLVLTIFAGAWMLLWARTHQSQPESNSEDFGGVADINFEEDPR